MGWVTHHGRRYYYHNIRDGRRVRAVYIGRGPAAEHYAALAAERRAVIAEHAAQAALAAEIEAAAAPVAELVNALAVASLLLTGHHYDDTYRWRRIWEKQPMARTKRTAAALSNFTQLRLVDRSLGGGAPDPNPPAGAGLTFDELEDFTALVRRVDRDRPAQADLDALQQALIARPGLWRAAADLASAAIDAMIAQTELSTAQSLALRRGADELQATLAGPTPSSLECALAEQIAVCWLRLRICETTFAGATQSGDPTSIRFWEERVAAAQRRYQSACESLARIRRLAVRTPTLIQVNIDARQSDDLDDITEEDKDRALAAAGMNEQELVAKAKAEGHIYVPPWIPQPSTPEGWAALAARAEERRAAEQRAKSAPAA